MKNDSKKQTVQTEKSTKRPYAQPTLEKHGNVESLTLGVIGGPSCPILTDVR